MHQKQQQKKRQCYQVSVALRAQKASFDVCESDYWKKASKLFGELIYHPLQPMWHVWLCIPSAFYKYSSQHSRSFLNGVRTTANCDWESRDNLFSLAGVSTKQKVQDRLLLKSFSGKLEGWSRQVTVRPGSLAGWYGSAPVRNACPAVRGTPVSLHYNTPFFLKVGQRLHFHEPANSVGNQCLMG